MAIPGRKNKGFLKKGKKQSTIGGLEVNSLNRCDKMWNVRV